MNKQQYASLYDLVENSYLHFNKVPKKTQVLIQTHVRNSCFSWLVFYFSTDIE